jgi:hypothetical protein
MERLLTPTIRKAVINDPSTPTLIPLGRMKQKVRVRYQTVFDIIRQMCPGDITYRGGCPIKKESYLLMVNRWSDPEVQGTYLKAGGAFAHEHDHAGVAQCSGLLFDRRAKALSMQDIGFTHSGYSKLHGKNSAHLLRPFHLRRVSKGHGLIGAGNALFLM